jgi:hypothetical protein
MRVSGRPTEVLPLPIELRTLPVAVEQRICVS